MYLHIYKYLILLYLCILVNSDFKNGYVIVGLVDWLVGWFVRMSAGLRKTLTDFEAILWVYRASVDLLRFHSILVAMRFLDC